MGKKNFAARQSFVSEYGARYDARIKDVMEIAMGGFS
jgi:hypothetical protein